jgi:hypothetical protein
VRRGTLIAIAGLALIGALTGGCGLLDPPPTPQPIFITATPEIIPATITPPAQPSPVIAVVTLTPRPLPSATQTPLPSAPPTLTPSFTPSPTESPAPTGAAGGVPGAPGLPGACTMLPGGSFAGIYSRDAALQGALGCAVSMAVGVNGALQAFDGGRMLWLSQFADIPGGAIYAIYNGGAYQRFPDSWTEGVDPVAAPGGEGAPPDRSAPIRGFGKVWGLNPTVRNGLSWALGPESATDAQIQRFERGEMVFVGALGQVFVFIGSPGGGTWRLEVAS